MTHRRLSLATATLAFLLGAVVLPAAADRDRGREAEHRREPHPVRVERGYEFDHRHHHDRYYPPRGYVVDVLPHGHLVVPYRGTHYYFHAGVWYRPSGTRFVVVTPPVGLSISVLPPYYTTVWVGGVPYYYADGVYYSWRPVERTYVVVDPPRESDVLNLPPEPERLFIYPRLGQTEQQQATDRYECHRWAVDQTGFDPTRPAGGVTESQLVTKRADYQRASKACLEARGYSVR